jgi:hypothetical protein
MSTSREREKMEDRAGCEPDQTILPADVTDISYHPLQNENKD